MLRYSLLAVLGFLFVCIAGYGSSARLLVRVGPKCTFTVEELQDALGGTIVKGGRHKARETIEQVDVHEKCHLILLRNKIRKLPAFARKLGYGHIKLRNCCITCAVKKVRSRLAALPTSDKELPRLHPQEVGLFYDLMIRVDDIFKANTLTYWATCGTLLGAVRHRGMIPWDDDLDIAIFEKDLPQLLALQDVLAKEGLKIGFHPKYEIYKIYPEDGEAIIDKDGNPYPWKYPFLDIFPLSEMDGVYTYAAPIWKNSPKLVKRDHYLPEELVVPLPELAFGPLKLPTPHNALHYINRMYGKDWNRVAYVMFSHRHEKFVPKIKVDLINRTPPAYWLPKH